MAENRQIAYPVQAVYGWIGPRTMGYLRDGLSGVVGREIGDQVRLCIAQDKWLARRVSFPLREPRHEMLITEPGFARRLAVDLIRGIIGRSPIARPSFASRGRIASGSGSRI